VSGRWDTATQAIGTSLGRSDPQVVTQDVVDQHAATTGDAQWIHNDPERAAAESPFGGPIVQGFLLLALLTRHSSELSFPPFGPVQMLVNYGFDRVRFLRPVLVGDPVWMTAKLGDVREKSDGSAVIRIDVEVHTQDTGPPHAAAEWLFLAVPG